MLAMKRNSSSRVFWSTRLPSTVAAYGATEPQAAKASPTRARTTRNAGRRSCTAGLMVAKLRTGHGFAAIEPLTVTGSLELGGGEGAEVFEEGVDGVVVAPEGKHQLSPLLLVDGVAGQAPEADLLAGA